MRFCAGCLKRPGVGSNVFSVTQQSICICICPYFHSFCCVSFCSVACHMTASAVFVVIPFQCFDYFNVSKLSLWGLDTNHGVWHLIDQSEPINVWATESVRTKLCFLTQGIRWKIMTESWMKEKSNPCRMQRLKLVMFDKRKSFFPYNLQSLTHTVNECHH